MSARSANVNEPVQPRTRCSRHLRLQRRCWMPLPRSSARRGCALSRLAIAMAHWPITTPRAADSSSDLCCRRCSSRRLSAAASLLSGAVTGDRRDSLELRARRVLAAFPYDRQDGIAADSLCLAGKAMNLRTHAKKLFAAVRPFEPGCASGSCSKPREVPRSTMSDAAAMPAAHRPCCVINSASARLEVRALQPLRAACQHLRRIEPDLSVSGGMKVNRVPVTSSSRPAWMCEQVMGVRGIGVALCSAMRSGTRAGLYGSMTLAAGQVARLGRRTDPSRR